MNIVPFRDASRFAEPLTHVSPDAVQRKANTPVGIFRCFNSCLISRLFMARSLVHYRGPTLVVGAFSFYQTARKIQRQRFACVRERERQAIGAVAVERVPERV